MIADMSIPLASWIVSVVVAGITGGVLIGCAYPVMATLAEVLDSALSRPVEVSPTITPDERSGHVDRINADNAVGIRAGASVPGNNRRSVHMAVPGAHPGRQKLRFNLVCLGPGFDRIVYRYLPLFELWPLSGTIRGRLVPGPWHRCPHAPGRAHICDWRRPLLAGDKARHGKITIRHRVPCW